MKKKKFQNQKTKVYLKNQKKYQKNLDKISNEQKKIKLDLDKILSNIPNIPHKDVPNGKDENDNVEISKSGNIPNFDFKPKTHYELGEKFKNA